MTYRDPLYDKNSLVTGEDLDDLLNQNSGPQGGSGQAQQKTEQVKQKGQEVAGQAKSKAEEVGSKAQAKADEVGSKATEKADQGMDTAASGLSTAADKLRQQGEQQGGKAATAATTVADKLEGASGYLREKDTDQVLTDLEDLVRRKPVESLLAAAGIGLLLSRIFG
jgi:ElaB/YqjD/DUF883 family membrane-anchored ribosome-binding protein